MPGPKRMMLTVYAVTDEEQAAVLEGLDQLLELYKGVDRDVDWEEADPDGHDSTD